MGDWVLVLGVRVRGPLAGYAVGFGEFLSGQGYTPGSAHLQVQLVAQFSRFLKRRQACGGAWRSGGECVHPVRR